MQKKGQKDTKKFLKKMQKKLIIVFLMIFLVFCGLIGRLAYIEYTGGEKYKKIVLSQQQYDSQAIPYQRGDIVDAKGTVLATSIDVYNVILDCKVLNKNEKDIDPTIKALAACFPELDSEELYQKLKEKKDSQYEVLLEQLPHEEIQKFLELRQAEETVAENAARRNKEELPRINEKAVWFEKEYIRNYPYDSLAASLIGFVSDGNVGTIGLENYYNSTLNGINGRQYGYLNSDNNFEKTVKNPRDGYSIVTTIDANIQAVIEKKIAEFNQEYTDGFEPRGGSENMAAIAMNPQNGQVLAMANYPTFDLNHPRDLASSDITGKDAQLSEEGQMESLNKLWKNFCITYTYEPGSTVKPLTVAGGLDTGTLTGNETYICDGLETFAENTQVHCVSRVGHGLETVQKAIMDSCNDALMQMSYSIGKDNFVAYQTIFGFGQKTGIDLPGEERGIVLDDLTKLDVATNAFGQNFNCTMIQLASAFSSLVNGGKYYKPYVVKKILDSDGNTVEAIEPVLLKETVSEDTAKKVKEYLYATVSEGTGKEAKVNGYSMGGKTGTAEKQPRGQGNYLVSFIGYVPQENPQLVLYLIIDEPNAEEQAHSNYAQRVVKEILKEILPYMNLYPDEELKPEEDSEGTIESNAPQNVTPEDGMPQSSAPEEGM